MKTLNSIFTDWANKTTIQGWNESQRNYIINGMAQILTKTVEHYSNGITNLDLFDEMLNAQYNPDNVINCWFDDKRFLYAIGVNMSTSYIEAEKRWNSIKQEL